MKRVALPILSIFFLSPAPDARAAEPSPLEIAQRAASNGSPSSVRQRTTMTLVDGTSERTRTLVIARSGTPGKDARTRIEFLDPADVAGTVLLSLETKRGRSQHLYLPGIKRVRRIAGAQQGGAFMGSDFSYEDLAGREVGEYDYRRLADATSDGIDVYVIEATPKKSATSAYGKTVSRVRKNDFLTLEVRFFDGKGREVKVLAIDPDRVERKGDVRIPLRLEMKNLKDGHRTVLETSEVEIDPELPDALFDPGSLDRG